MSGESAGTLEFSCQQWDAVTACDQHVLVSAGAGTGKTRTVVGRILYLLGVELSPPVGTPRETSGLAKCSLRDIAAITFTNAAAADLKRKLRAALLSSGRREDAYEIDLARIGTIHSFCLELLREFALQTGANPRDELLDETASAAIRSEVVRDTLLRVLESGANPNFARVLERFSLRDVRNMLEQLIGDADRLRHSTEVESLPVPERAILDVALLAADALDIRLVDSELIDFERVIVRVRDLLENHPSVRSTLRRRIKTLIIDEFQDVDPLQKEIAYLLGDPISKRHDTTRLMLVGDAKQSIYGFRRADVTVWREVEHDFRDPECGRVFSTTESFRCTKQILGLVDSTIGRTLDTPVYGEKLLNFEVPFESLTIGAPHQESGPPVELIMVPANDKDKDRSKSERRQLEVAAVVRRAMALNADGYSWDEMAVVLRTWNMAEQYREAFESIGIPAYSPRTAGFYEQREILDLILALETLCDPLDDRALMGFLRSPFVGLKDETLLELRNGTAGTLWDYLHSRSEPLQHPGVGRLPEEETRRLEVGTAVLNRLSAMRDRIPTQELLEHLLDDTGYVAHLHLLGEDQDQAIANVFRFLRLARKASNLNTTQFLALVNQARSSERDDGERNTPQRDAVTVTTTHSAKGLEWRVVFWAGLGLDKNKQESGKIIIGRETLALRQIGAETQPEHYEALQILLAREGLAEEKRLWYVTATRAIERLILCGVSEARLTAEKKTQIADHLLPGLKNLSRSSFEYENAHGELFGGTVHLAESTSIEDSTRQTKKTPPAPAGELPPPLDPINSPAGRTRHSATEYLTFAVCPRRHWYKYTLGIREPALQSGQQPQLLNAVSRGLIVHDVLERLREDSEIDFLLDDSIRKVDETAPDSGTTAGREYRDHLRDEIELVAQHPDYRAIADLPTAQRELRFLYIASDEEFYEGSVDLAAADENGLVLLDVKTPQCDANIAGKKADAYAPQRDVYVRALEEIGGMEVGRFTFQFSRADIHISKPIDHQLREQATQFITTTARAIEESDPSTAKNKRECDFCGYAAAGWCCGTSQVAEQARPTRHTSGKDEGGPTRSSSP